MRDLLFKEIRQSLVKTLTPAFAHAGIDEQFEGKDLTQLLDCFENNYSNVQQYISLPENSSFIRKLKAVRNKQAHWSNPEYAMLNDLSDVIVAHKFLLTIQDDDLARKAREIIIEMMPKIQRDLRKSNSAVSGFHSNKLNLFQSGIAFHRIKGTQSYDYGLRAVTIWLNEKGKIVNNSIAVKNDKDLLAIRVTADSDTLFIKNFYDTKYVEHFPPYNKFKHKRIKLFPAPLGSHDIIALLEFNVGNSVVLTKQHQTFGRSLDTDVVNIGQHPNPVNLEVAKKDKEDQTFDSMQLSGKHFSLMYSGEKIKGKMHPESGYPASIITEDGVAVIQPGTKGEKEIPANSKLAIGWYLITFQTR